MGERAICRRLRELAQACEDCARYSMGFAISEDGGAHIETIDEVIADLDRAKALRAHALALGEKQA